MNTDGGGLAVRPASGHARAVPAGEAVRQLRGEGGARQVRRSDGSLPRLAVASGTGGWFCSSGTVVPGRG
ncbi:hypothetical protein [Streptomyces sp. NPDC012589]|uniref:thiolase C-terminal domain-containing protein n=1 Tax=Streptomyces sp. NPDC012589 TaxID=3364839 RepID=UPI003689466C